MAELSDDLFVVYWAVMNRLSVAICGLSDDAAHSYRSVFGVTGICRVFVGYL